MSSSDHAGESKADRRAAARAKAEQMQAAAARQQRQRKGLMFGLIAVVVLAMIVGLGIAIQRGRSTAARASEGPFGEKGVVTMPAAKDATASSASDPVPVRVYSDYMCPACAQFEQLTAEYFASAKDEGDIILEQVPIAILNRFSEGTEFSSRSASAAFCVAESDPAQFFEFNQAMYAAQPPEGTAGLTNEEMLDIAKRFIPSDPSMDACITEAQYADYADAVTDEANQDGVGGTPTVWVDGEPLEQRTVEGIKQAVEAARTG